MAIKDLIVFFVESAMMLIPAITEAILALAAGSVAGVAKAIEFGLAKLIGLVINLFAKLIGLGGLAKKVQAIFGKIRKRIDKAVNKLLKKAQKAGRRLLGKLGIGAKEKPKNKAQHDEQVKAGLMYLDQISNQEDKDHNKALTEEEAQHVAAKTKKKFPVFTSITPRNHGGKWVYDWTGSKGTKKTDEKVEGTAQGTGDKIRIKRKELIFDKLMINGSVWEAKTVELRRQLSNQEHSINSMMVETWIERRQTFIVNETESDNNQTIRKRIQRDLRKTWLGLYEKKLLEKGYSIEKIELMAVKFANSLTDAEYFRILHNPDRVAGGKAKLDYQAGTLVVTQNDKVLISDVFRQLKVIGDNKVNGHIGGQWKTRAPILHDHVLGILNSTAQENKSKLQMNVTLKIR